MLTNLKSTTIFLALMFVFLTSFLVYVIYVAFTNQTPVMDEKYFDNGRKWQTQLNRYKKAQTLGFKLETNLSKTNKASVKNNQLLARLTVPKNWLAKGSTDKNNNALSKWKDIRINLKLDRPATSNFRQYFELKPIKISENQNSPQPESNANSQVHFETTLPFAQAGRYEILLQVEITPQLALFETILLDVTE